jgi:hypothetical protein
MYRLVVLGGKPFYKELAGDLLIILYLQYIYLFKLDCPEFSTIFDVFSKFKNSLFLSFHIVYDTHCKIMYRTFFNKEISSIYSYHCCKSLSIFRIYVCKCRGNLIIYVKIFRHIFSQYIIKSAQACTNFSL